MQREAFTFQVTNANFFLAALAAVTLPILLGPRLENWFGDVATVVLFVLIALGIYWFVKAIRPIALTLLPNGLQLGTKQWQAGEITHVELNERVRRIGLKRAGASRVTYYYLKRRADLPSVQQALREWKQQTGVSVEVKDSWK